MVYYTKEFQGFQHMWNLIAQLCLVRESLILVAFRFNFEIFFPSHREAVNG